TYPHSIHVRDVNLIAAPDADVWSFAAANGYTIVSKDSDFQQRALLRGHPPKVIWLRLGNCATAAIVELMHARRADVQEFVADQTASLLVLS
ncbi:MAG: DUF5615 family PIN-like protein, partial [Planctomycetaceae bacterium]|nr:DUF5615 family PIN-like protein [Planctomycetaceae bacterium]